MSFTPNRRSIFAPIAPKDDDSFISGHFMENSLFNDENPEKAKILLTKKSSSLVSNNHEGPFQELDVITPQSNFQPKTEKYKIEMIEHCDLNISKEKKSIFQTESAHVPVAFSNKDPHMHKKSQLTVQKRSSDILALLKTPPMFKEYKYRSSLKNRPKITEAEDDLEITERQSLSSARGSRMIDKKSLQPLFTRKFKSYNSCLPDLSPKNLFRASFFRMPYHLNRINHETNSSMTQSSEATDEEVTISTERARLRRILKKGFYATYFLGIMLVFKSKVKLFGAIRPIEYLEQFESFKPYSEDKVTTFAILPSSHFSLMWGLIMMLLLVVTAILTPIYISFAEDDNKFFVYLNIITDIGFAIDIGVNFLSAYYDTKSNKLITNFRKIAINYLSMWFWIDVISIFPLNDIIHSVTSQQNKFEQAGKLMKLLRLPRLYKLVKMVRLVRVAKFLSANRSFNVIQKKLNLNAHFLKLLKLVVNFVFLNHFMACMWFFVARLEDFGPRTWVHKADLADGDLVEKYIASIYLAFQTLTTVGYGELASESSFERTISVIGTLFGVLIYSFMIGNLAEIFLSLDAHQESLKNKIALFERFAKETELPEFLRQKVRRFFEINYKECAYHCVDSNETFKSLSANLKTSLLLFSYYDKIKRIPFLQIDANLTASLLVHFKFLSVKRGEIIYREDDPALEVYFILSGRIKFVTHEAKEIYALSGGTYFGEIEVFGKEKRICFCQASYPTQLLICPKEAFVKSLEEFPDIIKQVESVVELRKKKIKERLEKINKAVEEQKVERVPIKQKYLCKTTDYIKKILTSTHKLTAKDGIGEEKGKRKEKIIHKYMPLIRTQRNSVDPPSVITMKNKKDVKFDDSTPKAISRSLSDVARRSLISHAERNNLLNSISKFNIQTESVKNDTEIYEHNKFRVPVKDIMETESKGRSQTNEEVGIKKHFKKARRMIVLIKKGILKYFKGKSSKVAPLTELKKQSLLKSNEKEKKAKIFLLTAS